MLRNFLIFLLRMTDKIFGQPKDMTDYHFPKYLSGGNKSVPKNLKQTLTIAEIREVVDLWYHSEVVSEIGSVDKTIAGGYKLTNAEKSVVDEFINNYNVKYNSPLAKALSENNEGK